MTTPSCRITQPEANPITPRLLATARHLISDGLMPHEIEMVIYTNLIADTPRASLFRAGVGVARLLPYTGGGCSAERDAASRLAETAGRALRGPRDEEFVSRYELAHARGRLMQASHDAAETLRRAGAPVTRDNLELGMAMSRDPRCLALVIDNRLRDSIEKRIKFAVRDYFGDAR